MVKPNVKEGLRLLREWNGREPRIQHSGDYVTVGTLFEELAEDQFQALAALGWEAVDDWVGYRICYTSHFNKWWDESRILNLLRLDGACQQTIEDTKEGCFEAYLHGLDTKSYIVGGNT